MIVDKVRNYLCSRTDVKFEELAPQIDTGDLKSLVEKYMLRVKAPVNSNLKLHAMNDLNEFAQQFYKDLIYKTGVITFEFKSATYDGCHFTSPRIIYHNSYTPTDIIVNAGSKEIKINGLFSKQIEIEFYCSDIVSAKKSA